jgi:hypothetical protein
MPLTAAPALRLAGIRLEGHIFCADKGDYYDITDGDYQHSQRLPK